MLPKTASLVLERLHRPLAADLASAFGFAQSKPSAIQSPALRELLLQEPRTIEGLAITKAILAARLPIDIRYARIDATGQHVASLRAGISLPVGTPEFLRACMRHAGVDEPKWSQYPRELAAHLVQNPRRVTVAGALRAPKPVFIKPAALKPFQAFVLRSEVDQMESAARKQLDRLLELPPTTKVWIAQALAIQSEWRYYVLFGDVIGFARFNPVGQAALPCPLLEDVSAVIATIPNDAPYGLDVAVLETGEITVTALRDAWGLQLVPVGDHSPTGLDFLRLLWTRWASLVLDSRRGVAAANSPSKAPDA